MPSPRLTAGRTIALTFLVATVATAGSLTYSLGFGFYPCHLCWYQRILMYPLVPITAYAYLTRDSGIWRLVLPLGLFGTVVAAYNSWLQLAAGANCGFGGCAAVDFRLPLLGLTIPNQSLLAFLLVTGLMGWLAYSTRHP